MRFVEYNSFCEVEKQWRELYSRQDKKKSFQHPDVIKGTDTFAYRLKFLAKKMVGNVKYYVCYDNTKTIMIIPIRYIATDIVAILGSLEDYDKVELLYDEGYDFFMLFKRFISCLKRDRCKELIWNHLPEYSEQYTLLKDIRDSMTISFDSSVNIDFGGGYEKYLSRLKKNHRQNLRTAYNRLKRDNNVLMFDLLIKGDTSAQMLTKKYDEYIKIYTIRREKHYKIRGGIHRLFAQKYHFLAKSYRSENSFLADISINGKIAAFMQGYISESMQVVDIPRLAINEDYNFFSPGKILINETIKYLDRYTKVSKLDLCGGDEKYKFDCGGIEYKTVNIRLKLV